MHTIGVLVHSLTVEYTTDILSGIVDYFNERDVRVVIGQIKNPHCSMGMFEYQNWSGTEFFFSEQVEGIIVISGDFTSHMKIDDFGYYLNVFSLGQPVVSIGAEVDISNCYNIKINCEQSYDTIIKHLKKQHKCQHIAFYSALKINSTEAKERYEAFIKAMDKNHMYYDESYFISGNFSEEVAYETMKNKYKSADEFPFDAIVASNDLIAIGCISALQEIGLRIPVDVKVVGFDDTSKSFLHNPRISTINQNLFEQGRTAAQLILKKIKTPGKHVQKQTFLDTSPLYRQSCGCIPMDNSDTIFMDSKSRIRHSKTDQERHIRTNNRYYNILSEIDIFNTIFDMVHSTNTLEVFSYTLKYIMKATQIRSMFISFYDTPITLKRPDVFVMPDKMKSVIYVNQDEDFRIYDRNYEFNPKQCLIPEKYMDSKSGTYLYHTIFSGEKNYGYLVCRIDNDHFAIDCIFMKIIINAITQAFEYSSSVNENKKLSLENEQLQQNNSSLTIQTKTDELTKLLNRRGFYEFGQRTIDMAIEMNSTGMVFFADLDGLKIINDTYGHKMGDVAIKSIAQVLSKSLRSNDICARLSGDEFGAIAVGMTHEHVEEFRKKIKNLCHEISVEKNFPFELSCSFGETEFNQQHHSLKELLATADERLYIEKRQKKMKV